MIAHGYLAIRDKHGLVVLAHAQNRSAMHLRASLAVTHSSIIQRGPARSTRQERCLPQKRSIGFSSRATADSLEQAERGARRAEREPQRSARLAQLWRAS